MVAGAKYLTKNEEDNMKNVILFAGLILALSSCDSKSYHVKGGTAITIDGDTIEFYGGTITHPFFGKRDIREGINKQMNTIIKI